jgi:integrase
MLSWKVLNSMPLIKYCKGSIVASRIYADFKGNKCSCGGTFTNRTPHPDDVTVIVPKCSVCNKYPGVFLIDVDAKDLNGGNLRVKIRNDQNNTRLDTIFKVLFTLQKIQQELIDGSFDIRKYDSALAKESFKFKNYVEEYLEHHRRRLARGEITPKGLMDKEGLIKRELVPFFGSIELQNINHARIKKFQDSYTTKLRTRDLALGELKCILNQAVRDDMLQVAPKFEPIPRSKQRDEIISRELVEGTIRLISKDIYRDMYSLLLIYPIRPGELRALTWKNVDFTKNEFTVCQHFSNEVLIEGRKSIKKDKKEGSITYPLTMGAREILYKYRTAQVISLKSFVFLSNTGGAVSHDALWEAWNIARKKLGHTFAPYECRHVSASALYEKTGGDLIKMKRAGGWTNTSTLERYVRDTSDMKDLF